MKEENFENEVFKELWDTESRRMTAELREELEAFKTLHLEEQSHPDPRLHQVTSFVKSAIRIAGYCFLPFNLVVSVILLILSEIVGIVEELV